MFECKIIGYKVLLMQFRRLKPTARDKARGSRPLLPAPAKDKDATIAAGWFNALSIDVRLSERFYKICTQLVLCFIH